MQLFDTTTKFLKSFFGVPSDSLLEIPSTEYDPVKLFTTFVEDDFDMVPFVVTTRYQQHQLAISNRLDMYEQWFRGDIAAGMLSKCGICESSEDLFYEGTLDYLEPTACEVTKCEACLFDNKSKNPCTGKTARAARYAMYYGNMPIAAAFTWYEELIDRYNHNRRLHGLETLIPEYASIFGGSFHEFEVLVSSNWSDYERQS